MMAWLQSGSGSAMVRWLPAYCVVLPLQTNGGTLEFGAHGLVEKRLDECTYLNSDLDDWFVF